MTKLKLDKFEFFDKSRDFDYVTRKSLSFQRANWKNVDFKNLTLYDLKGFCYGDQWQKQVNESKAALFVCQFLVNLILCSVRFSV